MPVSGLVVSLVDDSQLDSNSQLGRLALQSLREEPRIEIGAIENGRVAIVMDTASSDEDKQLWNWISSLPGVVHVDVVLVGFEQQGESDQSSGSVTPCQ